MKKKAMLALCLLGAAGYTNKVYAEEIIYEKDIPADKKDQYYYVEDETKVDIAKDLTKEAAIELQISIESNGFTKTILRSYIVKTGEEINHIEEKFESLEKAMEYVKALEDEGIEVSNVVFTNDTEVKSSSLNKTYETLEEAQKALEEFKKEYNENIDEKEIVDNETDEILEENEGTISYATLDEAKAALEAFLNAEENQSREFYFEGSVVGPKEDGTYTTTEINEQFESEEEAMEYLANLEKDGYEILDYEFSNDTEKKDGSLNETYETLEEAQKAIEEFKKEYNENIDEKEIVDNETDKVLESNEGTTSYETYEDAEKALNEFLNKEENQSREFYFEGTVVGPKGNGTYTTTEINEAFNSKADAEAFLAQLEKDGYTILSSTFTNDTRTDNGSLNETYETLEEAQKASEDFKKEYNENIDEKEIVDNETDKVLESNEGTTSYETYEEAEKALNEFLNAEENQSREFYFEGTVVGPKGNGTYTTTEINEIFNSKAEAEAFLAQLEKDGYTILSSTFTNDTRTDSSSLNETYETLEEAQKASEEFKKEYNENIDEKEIIDNETDKVLEKNEGTTSYETYEDAEKALNEFLNAEENQSREFYFEGTVVGPKENGIYTTTEINETFNSKAEAEAFLAQLEKDGYTILSSTFTNDTRTDKKTLDQTYDTLEEAEKALEEFKNEYSENFSSSNIEEIANSNQNVVEEKEKSKYFNTEDEAQSELDKLIENNHDYIITGSVDSDVSSHIEDYTYEETKFKSRLDAENEISRLKSLGYDTSDMDIELASIIESTITTEDGIEIGFGEMDQKPFSYGHFDVKIPTSYTLVENDKSSTISGTLKVSSVSITNNGKTSTITMEGPSNDETGKYKEYTSRKRSGLNVTNKSYVKITGTVTYKIGLSSKTLPFEVEGYLSEAENECGGRGNMKGYDLLFSSIKIINGKVYVDTNIVNIYKVSGTLHKEVEDINYYFTTQKTNLGYDYKVNAYGEHTVTLESGKLTGEKKIENKGYFVNTVKKDKTHTVNIKAEKTVTLESGKLTGEKKIENKGYFVNTIKKDKTHTVNIKAEKTVTLESGKLTGEKKIENKGYFVNTVKKDKTHTVNIKARKTITLKKGRLTGKKKIENKGYFVNTVKKNKTHTVNVSAEKTITLESGVLTADTKKDILEELYAIDTVDKKFAFAPMGDGEEEPIISEIEEENPKTGDNGLIAITIGGFSMIGMLASCCYLKKEEDDKIVL